MKGVILSIKNDERVVWYRLKPRMLTLKRIDNIRYAFDRHKEPKIDFTSKESYKKSIPRSFGYHDEKGIYAIMICEINEIHYILIKSHPLFKKAHKMLQKEFKFGNNF